MGHFELNLLEGRVPSRARRRSQYLGMLAYLALCGVVLVAVAYRSARTFVAADARRVEADRLLALFVSDHKDEPDIERYAGRLSGELRDLASSLTTLEDLLGRRVLLARILFGLSTPLPYPMQISNLYLDTKERTLSFNIAVPANGTDDRVGPGELVEKWGSDAMLMSQVTELKALVTERKRMDGRPVLVHRFSCKLTGGKTDDGPGPV